MSGASFAAITLQTEERRGVNVGGSGVNSGASFTAITLQTVVGGAE